MSIDGVSARTSFLGTQIINLKKQFDDLQQQLASQRKSNTYAGVGAQRGFAIGLRTQVSAIDSFKDTITNVTTRLNIANAALTRIGAIGTEIHSAAITSSHEITSSGQTQSQITARNSLDELLQLYNSQAGDRFLFSGRTIDTPPTAPVDQILNGVGTQAGLKQLITERNQADLGPLPAKGRISVTAPTATSVAVTEDAGVFGLKLSSITSSSSSVTVTAPTGTPATESLDVAAPPNPGDTLTFVFNLPDGTSESIQLTAVAAGTPLQPGQYAIDASNTATAGNIQSALNTAIGGLADGALVAASAVQASREFFGSPPQRVDLTAPATATTATALVAGTPANTLSWYTGETGTDPARGTAAARIDQSVTVQYGARANEPAFIAELQALAVFAAVTTSTADPNANAQISALYQRTAANVRPQSGQTIQDIQADIAGVQVTLKDTSARHTQTEVTTQGLLESIEGVDNEEIASKILAVQNTLNASFQTTSLLFQTTFLKFL